MNQIRVTPRLEKGFSYASSRDIHWTLLITIAYGFCPKTNER